ncbi:hypothetical protein V5N11_000104 [Cardamine amara subsp. amara]|uniref:TFIIS N-terminal domain-containing protein n=1 Tax=Cardamine amara subsp. amara TaxID=228776 RepID=A0ABD1BX94_CARAN
MVKIANAMERSNLHHRLVHSAVKPLPVLMKKKNITAESKKKTAFLGLKKNDDQTSNKTHGVDEIKQNLNKADDCKRATPMIQFQTKKQPALPPKKNDAEMLELFQIAKKSADVANAKGILAAKEETCICVETLSLLISYPISSTAKETRLVMEKLHRLTKHKDRKICNSASSLHQHWTRSIRDQQP